MKKRLYGCLILLFVIVAAVLISKVLPFELGDSPDALSANRMEAVADNATPKSDIHTGETSDDYILLVNPEHALPEDYEPKELVNLYEQTRHFQLASSDIFLEKEAFEAANLMFLQAENEGINGFILTSGYRNAEKQAEIFAQQQDGTAAKPGYSEHQTGLAFDVTARRDSGGFETTRQFSWLQEHCWEYGFILRYPQGKEDVTGTPYEPWHYRYVGVSAAQMIYENNWTLEEYCASHEK